MRYTFTNEISRNDVGVDEAVFEMWEMAGFPGFKKRKDRGNTRMNREETGLQYQYLLNGTPEPSGHPVYYPEKADIGEFKRAMESL